ncbi:hypothetical protein [Streptomyces zhihengii]
MTRQLGRGRPPVFNAPTRRAYLNLVTTGTRLGDAAAHVGVSINIPRRYARTDPVFADELADARLLGKKAREEKIPHGESRHNHQGCRCGTCRACSTTGRRIRRHTPKPEPEPAPVVQLPPPARPDQGTSRLAAAS